MDEGIQTFKLTFSLLNCIYSLHSVQCNLFLCNSLEHTHTIHAYNRQVVAERVTCNNDKTEENIY